MKKLLVFIYLTLFSVLWSTAQENIIRNGDFSDPNSYWTTYDQFNYWECQFVGCSENNPYAYTSGNCGNIDNASGTLSQKTKTIPDDAESGVLRFSHRTGTTNKDWVSDKLTVSLEFDGRFKDVFTLTNLENSPDRCKDISIDISSHIRNWRGKKITLWFISEQKNDGVFTVFRIDDVRIDIETSDGGGNSTGCVTWTDGSIPKNHVVEAAEYLCSRSIIDNIQDVSSVDRNTTLDEVCVAVRNSIIDRRADLPSDNYPVLQAEVYNLSAESQRAVKAMLFLDHGDGIAPLNNDYYNHRLLSYAYLEEVLRVVMEALEISPNNSGYDRFNGDISNLYCNVSNNDQFYGYVKRAKQRGWLENLTDNSCDCNGCLNKYLTKSEFWILLSTILQDYGSPNISDRSFTFPNNFSIYNSNSTGDAERGIVNFNKQIFSIPTYGFPIDFSISYHSNVVDFPVISQKLNPGRDDIDISILQRVTPLGRGWNHTYNIFAQASQNEERKDVFIIFQWPNGAAVSYNYQEKSFITKGVYDKLTILAETPDGNAEELLLTSKSGIAYRFVRTNGNVFNLTDIKDRNGNRVELTYENGSDPDGPDRLLRVSVPGTDAKLSFYYDNRTNYINYVQDNTGRRFFFSVDKYTEWLGGTTDAEEHSTTYSYGENGEKFLLKTITLPNGNKVTNEYYRRKLKQTTNDKYTLTVDFNATYATASSESSAKVSMKPSSGEAFETLYKHNDYGTVYSVSSNKENKTFKYKDSKNPTLPTEVKDENLGVTQTFEYDRDGNVERSKWKRSSISKVDEYEYNENNDVTLHRWPNGTEIRYEYDSDGNLREETGPLGLHNVYTVNEHGQTTRVEKGGVTTSLKFNGLYGNLSSVSIIGTSINASASYDDAGRIKSIENPNKSVDRYSYYKTDKLKSVNRDADGLALTTSYEYDANENLIKITDPKKQTTTLTYDFDTDDLVREKSGNYSRRWDYNSDGTLNYFTNKNGHSFDYTYYPKDDRREGMVKSDGYADYRYDDDTRLMYRTKKKSDDSSIEFEYDDALRLNKAIFKPLDETVEYEYDNANDQITKITAKGKELSYTYDELNRIKQVVDWQGRSVVSYGYTQDGKLHNEELGNGTTVFYHYDDAGRTDSIWSTNKSGTLLHAIGCSFDDNGNRVRESYFVKWPTQYNYSNLFAQPLIEYTYDNVNRLESASNSAVTHNDNGDQKENDLTGFTNGDYDERGNLLSYTMDSKDFSFEYDAFENRVKSNGESYIIDIANNSNVLYSSHTGQMYIHSPVGLVCSIDPATGDRKFYLYDFRGSTVAVINDNEEVDEYYKYDPFGVITEHPTTPGTTTPFLFVGRYGVLYENPYMYYMRARYYDPTLGRFLGEDPVWGTNLYPYADNNPLSNIDPQGTYIETALDIASLSFNIASFANDPSVWGAVFIGADVFSTAIPFLPAGGTILRGIVQGQNVIDAAKGGVNALEQVAVHGNSLKSLKPTWGYKLYSADGTFLKNGITSKLIPETRYTKAFMSDNYMVPFKQFPNRLEAYQWEFGQNQILRGPLNLNMH